MKCRVYINIDQSMAQMDLASSGLSSESSLTTAQIYQVPVKMT